MINLLLRQFFGVKRCNYGLIYNILDRLKPPMLIMTRGLWSILHYIFFCSVYMSCCYFFGGFDRGFYSRSKICRAWVRIWEKATVAVIDDQSFFGDSSLSPKFVKPLSRFDFGRTSWLLDRSFVSRGLFFLRENFQGIFK